MENQSKGIKPSNPDKYYLKLIDGKKWFDWLVEEYRKLYYSEFWWGFYQLWIDWKGERWILPYLLKWYEKNGKKLPDWIDKEIEDVPI